MNELHNSIKYLTSTTKKRTSIMLAFDNVTVWKYVDFCRCSVQTNIPGMFCKSIEISRLKANGKDTFIYILY